MNGDEETYYPFPERLDEDRLLVNCANCGRETACGEDAAPDKPYMPETTRIDGPTMKGYQVLGGRIKGRPWCVGCLRVGPGGVSGLGAGKRGPDPDPSPWQENAIKALEGE